MADVPHPVDEIRTDAGRQILNLTDRFGLNAYAAGWIHDRPTNAWRYLLSTPVLASHGPLWVYQRLLKLFRHFPLPEVISPLDVYVIDPTLETSVFSLEAGFLDMRAGRSRGLDTIAITSDIRIEGFQVTDGFVHFYRRLPENERRARGGWSAARTFDHKVSQLDKAA